MSWRLQVTLESDATFARGEALPGVVDQEVEHDPATGLPFIRGRVLKGLLVEACADILYALKQAKSRRLNDLGKAAAYLFGAPGSSEDTQGALHVGPALLPKDLQKAVAEAIQLNWLRPDELLDSLTAIRRQTSVDLDSGAPEEGSLRSTRVILRGTTFTADLDFTRPFPEAGKEQEARKTQAEDGSSEGDGGVQCEDGVALALLAACVKAARRGGLARNRGRGRLKMRLLKDRDDVTDVCFQRFKELVEGKSDDRFDLQD